MTKDSASRDAGSEATPLGPGLLAGCFVAESRLSYRDNHEFNCPIVHKGALLTNSGWPISSGTINGVPSEQPGPEGCDFLMKLRSGVAKCGGKMRRLIKLSFPSWSILSAPPRCIISPLRFGVGNLV